MGKCCKDEIYRYNEQRWEAMVQANALFTRPRLDLTKEAAQAFVNSEGLLGQLSGKRVLCLAAGGGQQSAAFAILGAEVTVVDLSPGQLAKDQQAAAHYGTTVRTVQGDMRDLSGLPQSSYDVVWHPYSLNFVPQCAQVFGQVASVIKLGGIYHFMCANPHALGMTESDWTGEGFLMRQPYQAEVKVEQPYQGFVFADPAHGSAVPPSLEYRHTLSSLVNGLVEHGFQIRRLTEVVNEAGHVPYEPGSWDHFTSIVPPWWKFWCRYAPEASVDETSSRAYNQKESRNEMPNT